MPRVADGHARVVIRLSPQDHARLKAAAGADHLPLSTWLRQHALLALDEKGNGSR